MRGRHDRPIFPWKICPIKRNLIILSIKEIKMKKCGDIIEDGDRVPGERDIAQSLELSCSLSQPCETKS